MLLSQISNFTGSTSLRNGHIEDYGIFYFFFKLKLIIYSNYLNNSSIYSLFMHTLKKKKTCPTKQSMDPTTLDSRYPTGQPTRTR